MADDDDRPSSSRAMVRQGKLPDDDRQTMGWDGLHWTGTK